MTLLKLEMRYERALAGKAARRRTKTVNSLPQSGPSFRRWRDDFTRLEFYLHVLAVRRRFHFKELPRVEAEHPGDNVGREGLHAGVEVAHHRVVVAAGVLDVVFNRVERCLQSCELFRSLQFRIILRHGEQALERAREL